MKRIIFTGKGGVGKTTILSTLARMLSREGYEVLAIDCDPSMNLAMSLGIPLTQVLSLMEDKSHLQERLGASLEGHPHHRSAEVDPLLNDYILEAADGVKLMVMGTVPHGGSGCLCSPVSLVKLLVSYMAAGEDLDFILIDSQAGVEVLGRGLSSEFDLSMIITEPTPKSLEVARHSIKLSRDLGVKKQMVIFNKAEGDDEVRNISQSLDLNGDLLETVRYDRLAVEADKKGLHILDYPPGLAAEDILRIKKHILEA
jgi:CO dehydrogenase maturation factor